MNKNNIDQALSALGDALKSQESDLNPLQLIAKFPDRSLNGNLINGGKILNFESSGIKDSASSTKITIDNDKVTIDTLATNTIPNSLDILGNLNVDGTLCVHTIEVENLKTNLDIDQSKAIKYSGDINGKGFLWAGKDYTKQFVYQTDKIFSSETINIAKDKNISINDVKVIDAESLGASVVRSNLRQVGTLQGLIVDGTMNINNYMIFDANSDRLGIGTDQPNGTLSVAQDGVEVFMGTEDFSKGYIGTFASHNLNIKTDNTTRISIEAGGNIRITKDTFVAGKLAVGVQTPDPAVDLHVNGAIKFNNKVHLSGIESPKGGSYNEGDIVWNSAPRQQSHVGWVCIKAGNPGIWAPFGEIK